MNTNRIQCVNNNFCFMHKTFGYHPKMHLLCGVFIYRVCVGKCKGHLNGRRCFHSLWYISHRLLYMRLSLCVFFWQRRFPHLVCFSTSNFPVWKRICVIIIVKNYSFSLHESNITNFTFALFLWFSYFHIMTIVVRTSCIAHATYYNAEYLHRIHFDESDKTLNCYLHKGINYKSVSFSRGNVIKSRDDRCLWKT